MMIKEEPKKIKKFKDMKNLKNLIKNKTQNLNLKQFKKSN